jgi:hypothetical protein
MAFHQYVNFLKKHDYKEHVRLVFKKNKVCIDPDQLIKWRYQFGEKINSIDISDNNLDNSRTTFLILFSPKTRNCFFNLETILYYLMHKMTIQPRIYLIENSSYSFYEKLLSNYSELVYTHLQNKEDQNKCIKLILPYINTSSFVIQNVSSLISEDTLNSAIEYLKSNDVDVLNPSVNAYIIKKYTNVLDMKNMMINHTIFDLKKYLNEYNVMCVDNIHAYETDILCYKTQTYHNTSKDCIFPKKNCLGLKTGYCVRLPMKDPM